MEIENKRADAELTRAKAEEQRVGVAAKNAEAALLQAESLKKLSEAASLQADALMRIAMFLESRGHSPHLIPSLGLHSWGVFDFDHIDPLG